MKKLILLFCLFAPVISLAESVDAGSRIVTFDEPEIPLGEIEFVANWKDLRPDFSDFKIETCRFLSDKLGNRFALVTFTRSKGGVRELRLDQAVGVFANGERRNPVKLDGRNELGERGSLLLHFGTSAFPLVEVETRIE